MAQKPGPHLAMAVLCEKVLEEKDGVLTIIRIIDRMTITATGADVPTQMPPGQVPLTLVVTLRSGDAKGRHSLGVVPELPSGEQLPRNEMPVLFEGEDRGVTAVFQIVMPVSQEGLYWFDIVLNGTQNLTRVPLRIVYQPMQTSATKR